MISSSFTKSRFPLLYPSPFVVNLLQRSMSNILSRKTDELWSSTTFVSIGTGRGETKSTGSVVTTIRPVAVRPLLSVNLHQIRFRGFIITRTRIKRQMNYNYFINKRCPIKPREYYLRTQGSSISILSPSSGQPRIPLVTYDKCTNCRPFLCSRRGGRATNTYLYKDATGRTDAGV